MNSPPCEKEQAVLEAVQAGRWDDELRRHAASCPVCADVTLVAHVLREAHECDRAEVQLPDASRVWWKAQWLARRQAAERAAQPMALVERVAYSFGVLSLLAMAVWQWTRIQGWFRWLGDLWYLSRSSAGEFVSVLWQQSSFVLLLSAGVLLFFLTCAAYLVWADE